MKSGKYLWGVGVVAAALLIALMIFQVNLFSDERARRAGAQPNPAPSQSQPQDSFNLVTSKTAATLIATNVDELIRLRGQAQLMGIDSSVFKVLDGLYNRALATQSMAHSWLEMESHRALDLDLPEKLAGLHTVPRPFVSQSQTLQDKTFDVSTEIKRLLDDYRLIRAEYEPSNLDVEVRQALIAMTLVYEASIQDIDAL